MLTKSGAPSPEHELLVNVLDTWAAKVLPVSWNSFAEMRPDVVRVNHAGTAIFVGDAKVSAHETCDTEATCDRLAGYAKLLAGLLKEGAFTMGSLAVATDSQRQAERWLPTLKYIASAFGMRAPSGLVTFLGDGTWGVCLPVTHDRDAK